MIIPTAYPPSYVPVGFWPGGYLPTASAAGVYHVISQPTPDIGAIKTTLAVLPAGTTQYLLSGTPNSEQWVYIRAVNACGVPDADPIRPKLRRVAFDASGNLIPDAPNAPKGLRLSVGAGGLVAARWTYIPTGQMAPPSAFNVYVTTGALPFDYNTPAATVPATGAREYSYSDTFADGTTVRVVVRAVSAAGGEESNTAEVSTIADAQAPAFPEELIAEVIA